MPSNSSITIAGIIQYEDGELICYDTTYVTLEQAQSHMSVDFHLVIVCELTVDTVSHPIYQFVDLAKLIDQYSASLTDWDDVLTLVSDHHQDTNWSNVLTYSAVPEKQYFRVTIENPYTVSSVVKSRPTPFKSNLNDRPNIFSLHHSSLVTGAYLNKKAPMIRNKQNRMRQMPDLVFTKTNKGNVSFENTLVSVDGNVGMPEYSAQTDELYVKNGAHFLRGTDNIDQNIVFTDFKGLCATGTTVRSTYFSDCAPDLFIKQGDNVILCSNDNGVLDTLIHRDILFWKQSYMNIKFAVPVTFVDNCNYIPIICFGGRLFFPGLDQISFYPLVSGDKDFLIVDFTVEAELLARIVAANLQHAGIFLGMSSIYPVSISYLVSNIFTSKEYNIQHSSEEWRALEYIRKSDIPFISVITTDKPYVFQRIDPIYPMHDGDLKFPAGSRGLLINGLTREIVDYTRVDYNTSTVVTTTPSTELFLSNSEPMAPHLSIPDTRVVQALNLGPDVTTFFPPDSEIQYSMMAGNRWVVRSKNDYVLYGQSNTNPFERDTTGSIITYTWTEVSAAGTPTVSYDAASKCAKAVVGDTIYSAENAYNHAAQKAASSLTWRKVLNITDRSITWYIYETLVEIPDGMRYNNSVWKKDPVLFKDHRNQFYPSTQLKDTRQYFLLDIQYAGETSKIAEEITEPESDGHPQDPVLTIEYQNIKDKLKIANFDNNHVVYVRQTYGLVNGTPQPTDAVLTVECLNNDKYNGRYAKLPNASEWGRGVDDQAIRIKYVDTRWVLMAEDRLDVTTGEHYGSFLIAASAEVPATTNPYDVDVIWRSVNA